MAKINAITHQHKRLLEEEAGFQTTRFNWDIPMVPTDKVVAQTVMAELRRWIRHFGLPILDQEIHALVTRDVYQQPRRRLQWMKKPEIEVASKVVKAEIVHHPQDNNHDDGGGPSTDPGRGKKGGCVVQ